MFVSRCDSKLPEKVAIPPISSVPAALNDPEPLNIVELESLTTPPLLKHPLRQQK